MTKLPRADFDALLALTPLKALNDSDLDGLFAVHEHRVFTSKEAVFQSREAGAAFFIVANKSFLLTLSNGREKSLTRGTLFGELAALSDLDRLGSAHAMADHAALLCFPKAALIEAELLPKDDEPKLLSLLYLHVLTYLEELFDNSIDSILQSGEGARIEFKEGGGNPNILKAISAFLNCEGGSILIGVNDHAEVIGIENYSTSGADKFDQDFQNLLREKLGSNALSFVQFSHCVFKGKGLYRIDCKPADEPIFMREGKGVSGERFIIRSGATNQQLDYKAALRYIARRFPNFLFSQHA